MHKTNLRSVDLNLLVVLDALLIERNVTRAAQRLHLSQPAVSHALDRLRSVFDDMLLERRGRKMALTTKAETLQPRLADVIAAIQGMVDTRRLSLREIEQTVRVAMSDYPTALLLPPLWSQLQRIAPGIRLVCLDWREGSREMERLQRGEVDVVLSVIPAAPDDICIEPAGTETYIGLSRKGHPIGKKPTLEKLCSYPHMVVSATGALRSDFDLVLQKHGVHRKVALSISSFLAVPSILESSDTLALAPRSVALRWPSAAGLARFTPPLVPPAFDVHVAYHRRSGSDPAIMAVAENLQRICRTVLGVGTGKNKQ